MLHQLLLAALVPAVMASPIAQRSQPVVPSGMGSVMYHNNIPTAAAKAMDMDSGSMKNAAIRKIADMGASVQRNDSAPNDKYSKAVSQTKNHARAPEPTVFVTPTQVVGRQINTTMLNDISNNAVSFATGIAESIASGLSNLPPSKRADKPASTSSAPLAAATHATNATSGAEDKCDCIEACSDIEGKSKQMKCIKECAQSCDGDDDAKKKKKDPVKDLLGSLGLREIIPAQIEHAKRPKPKPIKITEVAGEEAFEECMQNCKTHNCQHSSVGLSIDQCGKTSCEEACARHRKGMSGKKISKKGLESLDNYPAAKPAPKSEPKPPKHEFAAAKEEEEYEACMKECKTHNCQHSSVGLDVNQCGDTFCADGCAKYRKAEKFAAGKVTHKTHLRAVDSYPTKPEPKPWHDVFVAGGKNEEFEACMKECRTHNCQHSSVGLDVDQCGDTACADACAGYRQSAAGAVRGGMHVRGELNYPTSPKPAPQPAYLPIPKPAFRSHPPPTHKVTKVTENEEFEACVKECKTHNCQHSSVGLSIDQCGDTACAEACAGYKKGAKAGSKSIHKKQVQPVSAIEPLPAVPAVAPLPALPAVAPLPAVQAVDPVPAVPNVAPVPNVAVAPNPVPATNAPATNAPASPAGPGSHPPPGAPVAAKKGSEDYEACMKQCKSHNCQHTSVGLETEQCGKTSCEEECASYHEADAAISGKQKVKVPGGKLVPNPVPGPHMLAVPNVHDVPVAEGHASQEFADCVKKCRTHNCQKTGVGLGTEQCGDTSCEEKCSRGHSEAAFRAHGKA